MKSLPLFLLAASIALFAGAPAMAGDCGGCDGGKMKATTADILDTAVSAGSFNTLVAAVKAADLVDTLKSDGPFTVFAPTDDAFAALPEGTVEGLLKDKEALTQILTYHVVAGRVPASEVVKLDWAPTVQGQSVQIDTTDGVRIDGAKVIKADIETSNGIIHVIDRVILPRKDIVDTAVEAGSFKTLAAAVTAADLVETLKGEGPFTVFAPTDAAFAKLPAGTVEGLLKKKDALTSILTYHVVPGRVLAKDIAMGTQNVKTANGQTVRIEKLRDGTVTVDGAKVVTTDIICGNGIIHVIDAVILPASQ